MSDTNFIPRLTNITSIFMNDVNRGTYGFSSIAALRAAPNPQPQPAIQSQPSLPAGPLVVMVKGYYAPGDGGGGPYYFDPTDITSLDNGGTVIVSTAGGRWKLIYTEVLTALQFGADPTGTNSSTAAFNNALAVKARLRVPAGTYKVSDITVVEGMYIYGDSDGRAGASVLQVDTNNTAVFRNTIISTGIRSAVYIGDLRLEAAPGITGAKGFRQDNKDAYLAYSTFERVETSLNLQIGYDLFPIFVRWTQCRDGYVGTAPGGQDHWGIDANPTSTAQIFQTNHNQVVSTQFFHTTAGAPAAVDIQFGANWTFDGCDFELLACPAIRARGIMQGSLTSCWFEQIVAGAAVQLIDCPGPTPQSCTNWMQQDCYGTLTGLTAEFYNIGGNGGVGLIGGRFDNVPANVVVSANTSAIRLPIIGFSAASGAGAPGFLGSIFTPFQNESVLPFGPSASNGTVAAKLVNNGFTSIADGASDIGLTGAIKLTLSNTGNAASYSLPTSLVTFLRGKTVTLTMFIQPDTTGVEILFAAVWDSVATPSFSNSTAAGSLQKVDMSSAALQIASVQYLVGVGATSLKVGVLVGGNADTKIASLESMSLVIGYVNPASAGL